MADSKSPSLKKQQQIGAQIQESIAPVEEMSAGEMDNSSVIELYDSKIDALLDERKVQRGEMMLFVKRLTYLSFFLLAGLVAFQSGVRLYQPEYQAVNDVVFNILAVSVFGQVIGVIVIIVKSLWDDSEYLKKI